MDQTGNLNGIEQKGKRRVTTDVQISHSVEFKTQSSCPTAMASSGSGNLCFVSYTDDSLHMLDVRDPAVVKPFLSGGHEGAVKSIFVSPDESLIYTGGQDGTVKLWDVGSRRVI
jgi:WD40 repeat protein